ncbi:hypothetical protein JXJ21_17105 [candidate division KSB1 bacterium]|nr:hypothetical protein [candidate division KSB1 bacterium]
MFRNRNSRNKPANNPQKAMATICPFNGEDEFTDDDFCLEDDDCDSGWFFECKMCKGTGCSGYIKK